METTDNNEAPKRRLEDQAQAAKLDWTKPDAPAVPAAPSAPGRIPLRAVASMCVKADDVSFFATPAAKLLDPGHYMLSVQGAAIACTDAGKAPAAGVANQAQPVATFDGYDGESLKPVFTLIGTLNAGDKLCFCAPAQAAAPSDIEELFKEALGTVALHDLAAARAIGAKYQKLARQQAAPAAIPEGWKLVPVESTLEMDSHGLLSLPKSCQFLDAERCWSAMLAAAPAHPAMPALQQAAQSSLHIRKATDELSLPELAEEFAAVEKLGCDYTLSAKVCGKLYRAMTAPLAAPAMPALLDHAHAEPKGEQQ